MDELERRSEGQIKIERYWTNSLISTREAAIALESGIADLFHLTGSYNAGDFPLRTLGQTPLQYTSQWVAMNVWDEMTKTYQPFVDELSAHNGIVITSSGSSPFGVMTTTENLNNVLTDLKGLKIRGMGYTAQLLEMVGAVPVSMSGNQVTEAMDKGVLDGVACNPSFSVAYAFEEVGKSYRFGATFQGNLNNIVMNLDSWNELPANLKKVMLDLVPEHLEASHRLYQGAGDLKGLNAMKAYGMTISEATQEEKDTIAGMSDEVIAGWIADREAEGLPGQATYDLFWELYEKWAPLDPFM